MLLKLFGGEASEIQRTRTCRYCGCVHTDDQLCQPTITRRKFLFLSGATFALTAVSAEALIQPVVRASPTIPFDLAEANRILAQIYLPAVREMLNNQSVLLRKLQATQDLVQLDGQPFSVPCDIRGDAAIRRYRQRRRRSGPSSSSSSSCSASLLLDE